MFSGIRLRVFFLEGWRYKVRYPGEQRGGIGSMGVRRSGGGCVVVLLYYYTIILLTVRG